MTDFTNLDGFATGTAGADEVNADVQLAASDKIEVPVDTVVGAGEAMIVESILFVLSIFLHCYLL